MNAARETAQLAEIDAALERLYKRPEQYGRCERSGKAIPFERLDLVPWARTCDECDERPLGRFAIRLEPRSGSGVSRVTVCLRI